MHIKRTTPRAVYPVRARWVQLRADARQQCCPISNAPRLLRSQALAESPRLPRQHVFISTAPQHDARVRCKPFHLLLRLTLNRRHHGCVFWIRCTCKHEVLPHQHADFIAMLIEAVMLIDSAAPHPQHIEVGCCCKINQSFNGSAITRSTREQCCGNPIGASHGHRHPVHTKRELRAMFIRCCIQLTGPQANLANDAFLRTPHWPLRFGTGPRYQFHMQRMQRLPTNAARPPAIRSLHVNDCNSCSVRMHGHVDHNL